MYIIPQSQVKQYEQQSEKQNLKYITTIKKEIRQIFKENFQRT